MTPLLSVIIPFKDDSYIIDETIRRLNKDVNTTFFEIIIIDDGSTEGVPKRIVEDNTNVKVISNGVNRGVGYSFDRGVSQSRGEILLLIGADIRVEEETWLTNVLSTAINNPDSITASVCKGLEEDAHMLRDDRTLRYGADLLFTVPKGKLPKGIKADILQGHWTSGKRAEGTYEIPCLMGAAYVITREQYSKIGGWSLLPHLEGRIKESYSREETKFRNHRFWGGVLTGNKPG